MDKDEHHKRLVNLALSMYLGEKCKYCLVEFVTIDDLRDTVWVGEHKYGSLAHQTCFDKANEKKGANYGV